MIENSSISVVFFILHYFDTQLIDLKITSCLISASVSFFFFCLHYLAMNIYKKFKKMMRNKCVKHLKVVDVSI